MTEIVTSTPGFAASNSAARFSSSVALSVCVSIDQIVNVPERLPSDEAAVDDSFDPPAKSIQAETMTIRAVNKNFLIAFSSFYFSGYV